MLNSICRYGVPMQRPDHHDKALEAMIEQVRKESAKVYEQHTEPEKRQPMSEADRRALMHALADGKICKLNVNDGEMVIRQSPTRSRLEYRDSRDAWFKLDVPLCNCLSWSEVREPRVFEFTIGPKEPLPKALADALFSVRFKARFEEILEETT